jgi:hypothetical protein
MKQNENNTRQHNNSNHDVRQHRWIWIVLSVVLLVAFDLSPFGGNIRFYSTWINCGQKPVVLTTAPGAGISWYKEAKVIEPVRFLYQKYYCTPFEAERAGLSASPDHYEYKYLNK